MESATSNRLVDTADRQVIIDVRMPSEFAAAHIPGSINVPLPQLSDHVDAITELNVDTIVVMCQSGQRSLSAARSLEGNGKIVDVFAGGLNAWIATGGNVIEGKQKWSLERQVRLVAGSIVLGSIIVSTKVPRAKFVAGFIGAGLTFAAVSNTCAMASGLALLPYNQDKDAASPAETLAAAAQDLKSI